MKLERSASEVQSGGELRQRGWQRRLGRSRGWLKPLEAKRERRPMVVLAAMVAGAGISGWKAAESGRLAT